MPSDPDRAPQREWTWARIRRDLTHITDIEHLKWRWSLRVTKPRYGIETIRDFLIDEQYGGRCGGTYHSRWNDRGYRGTSSIQYYYVGKAFLEHNVHIDESDVLVDVGCGKGRVLNYWLHRGLRNHMVGIEIDERWAEFARRRLERFPNVDILCGDAFDLIPEDGTIFFIFNPFNHEVTEKFKDHLTNLRGPDADITLVYYMAQFAELFEDDPAWQVTPVLDNTFHPTVIARLSGAIDRVTAG